MSVLELTDANFDQEVIKSGQPVLVDFWAPWCGPCRQVAPVVEEIAGEYTGKLKVGKLNVDDNPQGASNFGVMNIPTLLFFKGGKPVDKIVGAVPKNEIKAKVDGLL